MRRGPLHPLSIAPMMDRSDRHFRVVMRRLVGRRPLLYTEMITTGAVLHGDRERLLGFDAEERPLVLQLGGDDPAALAACARIAAERGYDEVNLNVGCPSERVQKGSFGVCLMERPERVAAAVAAMRDAVPLPVTVKHRIGFDDLDRYEDMARFVDVVAAAGCDRFIVHARKAWLTGLDPKENREVPPLRYEDVYRLKRERPGLAVEINGGVRTLGEVRDHLARVDGVMVGRAAYEDPWALAGADQLLYGEPGEPPTRREVVESLIPYAERQLARGVPLARIARHLLGLVAACPGARAWRRILSERTHDPGAGAEVLRAALAAVPAEVLDEPPAATAATGTGPRARGAEDRPSSEEAATEPAPPSAAPA
jgi:tRNA-dihydrouridine synthase A